MARQGQFSGGSVPLGQPLSILHPADNDVTSSKYADALKGLNLSQAEKDDLQARIDELYAALQGEREFFPKP